MSIISNDNKLYPTSTKLNIVKRIITLICFSVVFSNHFDKIEDYFNNYSDQYNSKQSNNQLIKNGNNVIGSNSVNTKQLVKTFDENEFNNLCEQMKPLNDLFTTIKKDEVPSLLALKKFPEYFSIIMDDYHDWDNYTIDETFFKKGAFIPPNVQLFEGIYGDTYYSRNNCAPYYYEYWYETNKSLTLTNKYTQQKVYCTGCRDATEALPESYKKYTSTKNIKKQKINNLISNLKSKSLSKVIIARDEKLVPLQKMINFLNSQNEVFTEDMKEILNLLKGEHINLNSKSIINPKTLRNYIDSHISELNNIYSNFKNSKNKQDKLYFISRYIYLSNSEVDEQITKQYEKEIKNINKVIKKVKSQNKIKYSDKTFHLYPLTNHTLFLYLLNTNKLNSFNLNFEIEKQNVLLKYSEDLIDQINTISIDNDLQLMTVSKFNQLLKNITQSQFESFFELEIENRIININDFNKDNFGFFGLLSGDVILLHDNNETHFYKLKIDMVESWGIKTYNFSVSEVNEKELDNKMVVNVRPTLN